VRRIEADEGVAAALGIEVGSPVYERARLVKDNGTPTHTLASYYKPEHVEGTPLVDPAPGPAGSGGGFAVLTIQGFEPDQMSEASTRACLPQANGRSLNYQPVNR